MKKHLGILGVICIIFISLCMTVEAEDTSIEGMDSELHEISENKGELVNEVIGMIGSNHPDLEPQIGQAVKVYVDADLFSHTAMTTEELNHVVMDSDHVWLLPFYSETMTYWATITRGQAVSYEARQILDETEIERLESKVGKLTVSEVIEAEGRYSYTDALNQVLDEHNIHEGNIYLFGGTTGYRELLAVVTTKDNMYFLPLNTVMNHALNTSSEEEGSFKGTMCSFDEMRAMAEVDDLAVDEVGGMMADASVVKANNNRKIRVGIFAIAIFAITILVLFGKRRGWLESGKK